MISANCYAVMEFDEVVDRRDAGPKYWLIVTPVPAIHTRLGCSGLPIAMFKILSRPEGTKLHYMLCSSKESCSNNTKQHKAAKEPFIENNYLFVTNNICESYGIAYSETEEKGLKKKMKGMVLSLFNSMMSTDYIQELVHN